MKTHHTFLASGPFYAALCGILMLASCASMNPYEKSTLVDAGFRPASSQDAAFASLPDGQLQRITFHGKVVYACRDSGKGITYVGGEAEYQRYQHLIASRGQDRADRLNQQMNQNSLHSFRY